MKKRDKRNKQKDKPKESKIWASLYEKMRNHDEPIIPAPSTPLAALTPEKIEIGMKRLFDTATKK